MRSIILCGTAKRKNISDLKARVKCAMFIHSCCWQWATKRLKTFKVISARRPVITFQFILVYRLGDELLIDSNGTGAIFDTNVSPCYIADTRTCVQRQKVAFHDCTSNSSNEQRYTGM